MPSFRQYLLQHYLRPEYRRAWIIPAVVFLLASPLLVAIPELFRKEGPIEHLTHVVLALGLYYWIQKIWRGGMSAKVVAFAALHLFFLGEEVDWGQVYFPFEPPQFFLDLSPRNDP